MNMAQSCKRLNQTYESVCVPDESGPAGAPVQTAQVTADSGLLELLHVLQLFFSHIRPLSHKQLHQVKQLLHRLQRKKTNTILLLQQMLFSLN